MDEIKKSPTISEQSLGAEKDTSNVEDATTPLEQSLGAEKDTSNVEDATTPLEQSLGAEKDASNMEDATTFLEKMQIDEPSNNSVQQQQDLKEHKYLLEIVSAKNLPICDEPDGLADPYVVVKWGQSTLGETETIIQNLDPDWNDQKFCLSVAANEARKELVLEIWDWDAVGDDDYIGEICIDPATLNDLVNSQKSHELQIRKGNTQMQSYDISKSKLTITIEEIETLDEPLETSAWSLSPVKSGKLMSFASTIEHPSHELDHSGSESDEELSNEAINHWKRSTILLESKKCLEVGVFSVDNIPEASIGRRESFLKAECDGLSQETTTILEDLSHKWIPAHRFVFPLADIDNQTLKLTLFDYDQFFGNIELGSIELNAYEYLRASSDSVREEITLTSNNYKSSIATLSIQVMDLEEANLIQDQFIYEYSAYVPFIGWSPGNLSTQEPHFVGLAPGTHTSGDRFSDACPAIPGGFEETECWSLIGVGFGGKEGEEWSYARSYNAEQWTKTSPLTYKYRRQIYKRRVEKLSKSKRLSTC